MSVLDRLPDIIASAAGVLFQEYTLRRFSGRTSDGRGGFTPTFENYVANGQVTDFSDELRYLRSIPEDARLLILQGKDIPQVPRAEDYVAIDGESWKIISVETIPSNAVYQCEVHRDTSDWGIDLATTITATPDLLAGLGDQIAGVGEILFENLQYFYLNNHAEDGRGGNVRVLGAIDVRGLVTEYSERLRAVGGIDENDRMVIIQGKDLSITPQPGDIVRSGVEYFVLTNVKTVPGKGIYEGRGRPTTMDAATLPAITADASGTVTFSSSSVGEVLVITADASAALSDFTSSSVAWLVETADASVSLEDFVSAASAVLPITADASVQLISAFSVESLAEVTIEANAGAPMADFTGSATGGQSLTADAAATLENFTSSASGSSSNQGDADVIMENFTGAGQGDVLITGDQTTQIVDFTGAATAEPVLEADASATLDAFTAVADAVLSIEGVHAAVMADFTGASSGGQGDLTATAAATIQDFSSTSDADLSIEADASSTIDAFTSVSSADLDIVADASATMDDFTSSSDGTVTSGGGNEAETDALIAEMTVAPDSTREGHINTLIKAIKDAGAWSKLDWFSFVGHSVQASQINWIVPTEEMTSHGNPTGIVVDSHYDTHDSVGSAKSGWDCQPASKSYSLGDVTFGIYFKKLDENSESRASRLSDNNTWFRCDFSSPYGKMTGIGNFNNSYTPRVVNANYHMTYVHQGTGAADRIMYYQGASVDTLSGAGGSLNMSSSLQMGASTKNEDTHLLCGYLGTALTAQEVSDLHDAIEVYRIAIGA